MQKGEVWFVEFPLEEDSTRILNILYWEEAGLRLASTARVSKVTLLSRDSFIFRIGSLCQEDMERIEATYREFLANNTPD